MKAERIDVDGYWDDVTFILGNIINEMAQILNTLPNKSIVIDDKHFWIAPDGDVTVDFDAVRDMYVEQALNYAEKLNSVVKD